MKLQNDKVKYYLHNLIHRYPALKVVKKEIMDAYIAMGKCYLSNGKLLVAGNGGSAADAEHIVGELGKGFCVDRKIPCSIQKKILEVDKEAGEFLNGILQKPLPAIALNTLSLSSAFANDVDPVGVFAQLVLSYGEEGDVFLALSTSGNSTNILYASIVAKAMGLKTIILTGKSGGILAKYADISVKVPEEEVHLIQEYHLPIYHCWCMMLEKYFFNLNT